MGGKSKSSTGISLVDNAVDSTVETVTGINNVPFDVVKALPGIGMQIERGVQGAGKNFERNMQQQLADLSQMGSGNFNNYGQYFTRTALQAVTGGTINPKEANAITGATMSERKAQEAIAKEAAAAAQDAANVAAEKSRQLQSTISGVVGAAQRAPGRTQTLLRNAPASSNTLLTITGNR